MAVTAKNIREITFSSSIDGSEEPAVLFEAGKSEPRPLIVCLHPWSRDRRHQVNEVVPLAETLGCNAVFPEFRGPNLATNPRSREACASMYAVQDVLDTVNSLRERGIVVESEIILMGVSGGGYMSLMMAARKPDLWKSVIAFCPITDLVSWHGENKNYAPHIEACLGGPPDTAERIREYLSRSPAAHADKIADSSCYILHGKHDASVPFTHSMNLFKKICDINPAADVYCEIFNGFHEQKLDRAAEIIKHCLGTAQS
jgi:dipeptidyl aminopeptidase/acylaminoacyl peptidase